MRYEIQMIAPDSSVDKFSRIANRTLKERSLENEVGVSILPYGPQGEWDSISHYGGEFIALQSDSREILVETDLYGPNEDRLTACLDYVCKKIHDKLKPAA